MVWPTSTISVGYLSRDSSSRGTADPFPAGLAVMIDTNLDLPGGTTRRLLLPIGPFSLLALVVNRGAVLDVNLSTRPRLASDGPISLASVSTELLRHPSL